MDFENELNNEEKHTSSEEKRLEEHLKHSIYIGLISGGLLKASDKPIETSIFIGYVIGQLSYWYMKKYNHSLKIFEE